VFYDVRLSLFKPLRPRWASARRWRACAIPCLSMSHHARFVSFQWIDFQWPVDDPRAMQACMTRMTRITCCLGSWARVADASINLGKTKTISCVNHTFPGYDIVKYHDLHHDSSTAGLAVHAMLQLNYGVMHGPRRLSLCQAPYNFP
jgi:hypothetical protein